MKYIYWIALIFLLSSCSLLTPLPHIASTDVNSWRLNGRIIISSSQESWTIKVHWLQQDDVYKLHLNTPTGQGAILLEGSNKIATMRTANNETFTSTDPDSLILEVLKINIPISHLRFWIRGIPANKPAPHWYVLNEANQHLDRLRQDGWEITFKRYTRVKGIELPDKIFLENDQFKVKIAISHWDINSDLYL
ncbi:MAG: outer membrane lipoprotein LolB [Thiomargarita sp.]|nr:outer membrane lipoprotein LolB [Thiomargarita sp.]